MIDKNTLDAKLDSRTFEHARVQAFRHPLVAPPPTGFHGGPVLGDSPTEVKLRHSRYWRPVDHFLENTVKYSALPGHHIYLGPIYHHFGHVMSEMVHRILPSLRIFPRERFLLVTTLRDMKYTNPDRMPKFFSEILEYFQISQDRLSIINDDRLVDRLSICEQGSDFGGGPKPGYLGDLRTHAVPSLARLHRDDMVFEKIYVSRGNIPHGGSVLGEHYLERLFEENGYLIFHPEQCSLTMQMHIYNSAKIIVFAEGSACHGTELLGEEMLGRCIFIKRPGGHADIFRKILSPRALEFRVFDGVINIGSAVVNAAGKPLAHLGSYAVDLRLFAEFFRESGMAFSGCADVGAYFDAAERDFDRYLAHHVAAGSRMVSDPDITKMRQILQSVRHQGVH